MPDCSLATSPEPWPTPRRYSGSAQLTPLACCSKGLILLEANDFADARAAFDLIEDPDTRARALLPHAAATFWSGDQAKAAALLRGDFSLDRREWDDIGMAELLREVEFACGSEDSVGPLLDEALERILTIRDSYTLPPTATRYEATRMLPRPPS